MNGKLKMAGAFGAGLVVAFGVMYWWPSPHNVKPVAAARTSPVQASTRSQVTLPKSQALGIGLGVAPVRVETSDETLRAVSTIVPDEARISHIHTRVSGWVEKLYVPNTGERVKPGQPIIDIFSQELYASQLEHLAARAFAGPPSAVQESGRARLKFFGMSERDIQDIEKSGKARRLVTLYAPTGGVLAHRGVAAGTAVDPSTEIAVVLDLSRVWAIADVPVAAMEGVRSGQSAELQFGEVAKTARIEFIEPMVSESRTLKVRFSLPNPDGALRPGMYGTATISVPSRKVLTVPREAVVDTGQAQFVYLQPTEGTYVPRKVKVGRRSAERVEISEGLEPGAMVVVSGVFLLDSESRLRGSGGQGGGHSGHGKAPEKPAVAAGEGEHKHD